MLLVSPERLNNPGFRDGPAEGWPPPAGCWSSTRPTASPTGATTSGPTTGGSAPCSTICPTASRLATTATANACRRPTCRAARPRRPRAARTARPRVAAPRGPGLDGGRQRLAWLADHLAGQPGSGIVYCLTVAATQGGRRLPALAGPPRAAYSGQTDTTERSVLEADLVAAESRRWSRRALSAWASTRRSGSWSTWGAALAGRLLPAGRPRGARHRRGVGGTAARRSRTATSGRTSRPSPSPASSSSAQTLACWPRTAPDEHRGPRDPGRARPHPARDDAQGPRRRRSRPTGPGGLDGDRQEWVYDADRYAGSPRRASASSRRDARLPGPIGCRMAFLRDQLDDPAPTCGRCDNCGATPRAAERVVSETAASPTPADGSPGRASAGAAQDVAHGARHDRDRSPGKIAEAAEEGRAVARLTDLGHGQALRDRCSGQDAEDGPVPVPWSRPCSRCSATGDRAADAIVVVESGHPADARDPDLAAGLARYLQACRSSAAGRSPTPSVARRPGRGQLRPARGGSEPRARWSSTTRRRSTAAGECCSSTTWSSPGGPSPCAARDLSQRRRRRSPSPVVLTRLASRAASTAGIALESAV